MNFLTVWGVYLQVLLQKKPARITNKMKNLQRSCIFFIYLLLGLTACITVSGHSESNIYDTWTLEKIIYDDKSVKVLEKGNFVQIHKDYILEIITGYGNRHYPYIRKNKILSLASGSEIITWEITQYNNQELQVKTPIGLYLLKR